MKKILVGVLAAVVVIAGIVLACIMSKPNDETGAGTANIGKENDSKETTPKYEDLTKTRRIGSFDDLWLDLPGWREDGSETCTVAENLNYYIIAITSDEYDSFDELFNNVAKPDLKHFVDRGTYEDFVPETKEEVTLSNGVKATKFESTLRLEDYGDKYEYPAYGYYFEFNNKPIIILSIETHTGSKYNSEEGKQEANKYVDQVVQTIRSKE